MAETSTPSALAHERRFTERDLTVAKRAAHVAAAMRYCGRAQVQLAELEAVSLYPFRRVRIVVDPHAHDGHVEYCVIPPRTLADAELHYRTRDGRAGAEFGPWIRTMHAFDHHCNLFPTPQRAALWAELFANPTEEVEADA